MGIAPPVARLQNGQEVFQSEVDAREGVVVATRLIRRHLPLNLALTDNVLRRAMRT
jgi:hypothetical protein